MIGTAQPILVLDWPAPGHFSRGAVGAVGAVVGAAVGAVNSL